MKKKFSVALSITFLVIVLFLSVAISAEPAAEKIATVNGTVITKNEYDRELARYKERITAQGAKINDSDMPAIKTQVIENIVGMLLMYQDATAKGITADQAAIDNQWKQLKSQYPDEQKFQDALKQLNVTEESIKEQIKRGLTLQKFIKENFYDKVSITDSEVKAFYDNNPDKFNKPEAIRASHILITVKPDADEAQKKAARAEIEKIQARIKAGEDFAKLAKENSKDPGSKENGGDLGFFTKGQMVKPFEDAAFALKPGMVSDIVETQFGYHIIKVTDRKAAGKYSLDEIKTKLQAFLEEAKVQQDISDYVKALKEKAKIELF